MNTINKKQYHELKTLLMKSLPKTINASNNKRTANNRENRNRDKEKALNHCAFIQYNSPKMISILIFDIDFIDGKKAVEIFSLYEMVHEIYRVTSCIPTYVLQTTKGYHFAFHLANPVFLIQGKAKKYVKDMKNAITEALQCDKIASSRLHGIWRNPLKHPFWYSGEQNYDLSSFKHLSKHKNRTIHTKVTRSPLSVSIAQLEEGQRNNKLFLFGVNFCLANKLKTYNEVLEYLLTINKFAKPPLEESEVSTIATSVFRRKEEGTLFTPKQQERNIQQGIMNFEKMAGLSYKNYCKETKRR